MPVHARGIITKPVDPNVADAMQLQYVKHPDQLITYDYLQSPPIVRILRGFRIAAPIISAMKSGGATQCLVLFAVRESNFDRRDQQITVVLCGATSSGRILNQHIYDYLDPCPSKCVNIPYLYEPPVNPRIPNVVSLDSTLYGTGSKIESDLLRLMQCVYMGNCNKIRLPGIPGIYTLKGLWYPIDLLEGVSVGVDEIFLMFTVQKHLIGEIPQNQFFGTLVGGVQKLTNDVMEWYYWFEPFAHKTAIPLGVSLC